MAHAAFDFAPLQPVAPPPGPAESADQLLAAAQAEAGRVQAEARAEGFAAGHHEALEGAAPAAAALEEALRSVEQLREQLASRLEGEAVELAFALAERILQTHVEANPAAVVDAVRGALRGVVEREHITVLVHPDDLGVVRAAGDELRASLGGISRWDVQAERRVGRGGAVVHFGDGLVDASHAAKLERAREVLAEHAAGQA